MSKNKIDSDLYSPLIWTLKIFVIFLLIFLMNFIFIPFFSFLDEQIIEFMQNVAPLFPNNFIYSSRTEGWNSDEERTGKMRRLLATMRGQIYSFCSNNHYIHIFDCQLFPRVLDHIHEEIYFSKCEKESGMMLLNWLTNNNGRLKTLYLQNVKGKRPLNAFVRRIKEVKGPINYLVDLSNQLDSGYILNNKYYKLLKIPNESK